MEGRNPVDELLELILSRTTLQYLSDLHSVGYHDATRAAVLSIPARQFSVQSWQTAAEYILKDSSIQYHDSDEARRCLAEALKPPIAY